MYKFIVIKNSITITQEYVIQVKKINQRLSNAILRRMKVEENFSGDEGEIIRYMLVTSISETEKILLLFLIFFVLGQAKLFFWICLATLFTHPFTGGLHRETFWGCFFQSLLFFIEVTVFGHFIKLSVFAIPVIFLFSLVVYFLYVPTASEKRGEYGKESRKRIRKIAIAGMSIVSIMSFFFSAYRPFFLWVLILEDLELLLLNILKKKEEHKK